MTVLGGKNGFRRIALVAAAAMVVAGLFAIAYIHASSVADCLNKSLGSRNPLTTKADAAVITFNHAQRDWAAAQRGDADALQNVLSKRNGSSSQSIAFGKFLAEHAAYDVAAKAFAAAAATNARITDDIKQQRTAHPLGQC